LEFVINMLLGKTSECSARNILRLFVELRCQPGDGLGPNTLYVRFPDTTSLKSGIDYAAQQGWVEFSANRGALKITALGLAEAPRDLHLSAPAAAPA
jgi:hypothetical protein